MNTICCFGELLLRYSPDQENQWITSHRMPCYVGGAELNVANALANWNLPVKYVTALPDHFLSHSITKQLRENRIDVSAIEYCGERIGAYYLQQGADLKHAGVIYDRKHSSFSSLRVKQVNWDRIFDGVSWLHFSAISPALTLQTAEVCREALEIASAKNITISVDLNYRSKLWQYGKQPVDIMPELVQHCDVIMGNIWAVEKMLGITISRPVLKEKEDFLQEAERISLELMKHFPKCRLIANTFRFDLDKGLKYYAMLYENNASFVSREYGTETIIDRVGTGDCFMAGLIYGQTKGYPQQEIIDFAAAAAFDKFSIQGDATNSTVERIRKIHLKK